MRETTKRKIGDGRLAWAERTKGPLYLVAEMGYETPCWIWQRALLRTGYGAVNRDGRTQRAHRWMYEQIKGPIPGGLPLDHLCEQKACVNPDHLEPVAKRENERRHWRRRPGQRKKCANGHALTKENALIRETTTGRPRLLCRICNREHQARYKAKIKASSAA